MKARILMTENKEGRWRYRIFLGRKKIYDHIDERLDPMKVCNDFFDVYFTTKIPVSTGLILL